MITESQWIELFREEVKYQMKQKNMSQRELADRSRLAESTVCDVIYGRRIPNTRTVVNVAYALEMDVGQLIDFGHLIE